MRDPHLSAPPSPPPGDREPPVAFRDAIRVWAYIALNSFGGPAGQIAVMHRVLVDGRHWVSERRFLHALNYCMLLPGPEAQQLAVYIGWLMHGLRGALAAGTLFILPGALAILALSIVYAGFASTAWVAAVFYGIKPAVMAIVAAAVVRVGRRALGDRPLLGIAAAAFIAIWAFDVPFPVIIIAAAALGLAGARLAPSAFAGRAQHGAADADAGDGPILRDDDAVRSRPAIARSALVLATGLVLWLGPVVALVAVLGPTHVYAQQATFFSGAAVVTFGGAYAVLSFVAQQAVDRLGWLSTGEMIDGLALAETTPGPLIMVVQFVGFLAAYRFAPGLDPMVAGVLGAALVTWVTFVPSFLWILLGAPYVEALRGRPALASALAGITAAVVGVILNLAVWFSLHTLFRRVEERPIGPLRLDVPDPASIDLVALAIALFAFVALFRLRWPILVTLGLSAAVGAVAFLAGLA